jgi:hypothetical protein
MNNSEDILKQFERVRKVEPSPWLREKIRNRLNENFREISAPAAWTWCAAAVLLLLLNIAVVQNKTKAASNDLTEQLGLIPNNNLYQ